MNARLIICFEMFVILSLGGYVFEFLTLCFLYLLRDGGNHSSCVSPNLDHVGHDVFGGDFPIFGAFS